MSGPIVRQYGVPNWDEIFGKKEAKPADAEAAEKEAPPAPAEQQEKKKE